MRRLTANTVRFGLVTAWRLAGWPTSRSPSAVKATMDGVVRPPSEFSITFGVLPSMTATHELVVPRSIPMTFAISHSPFPAGRPDPRRLPSSEGERLHRPPTVLNLLTRWNPIQDQASGLRLI